jgi:predicted nucleic acid-binding protein
MCRQERMLAIDPDRILTFGVRGPKSTTITVAEVPTGPLQAGDEALARRYRAVLESWQCVELDVGIAESAARLRASLRLELPDAVQAASALATTRRRSSPTIETSRA